MNPLNLKSTATSPNFLAHLGTRLKRPHKSKGQGLSPAPVPVEQPDPLIEIGSHLHQVRLQQAKEIEDISAETMITPRILAAIEQGQGDALPEAIYVKGMIRRYGDALGLEGHRLAAKFMTQPPLSQAQPANPQPSQVPAQISTSTPGTKPSSGKAVKFQPKFHPIYLYLLYVVIIVAAGSGLSYVLNQSPIPVTQSLIPSPPTAPKAEETEGPGAETEAVGGVGQAVAPASTPQSSPVQAGLTIKLESWVEVVADGKTLFSGVLPVGTKKTLTADKKLIIRTGNAGGVLLSVQDQPDKPMGAPGEVVKNFVLEAPAN